MRVAWGFAAGAVVLAVAAPVAAEDEPGPDAAWLPALTAAFEIFEEDATGEVGTAPGGRFGGVGGKADTITAMRLGGDVLAPALHGRLDDLRPFFAAGVQLDLDQEVPTFQQGDALSREQPAQDVARGQQTLQNRINRFFADADCGPPFVPPFPGNCDVVVPPDPLDPDQFRGQGSEVSAKLGLPGWWLQLGVAYTIPWWSEMRVRVKPSLEYFGEEIRAKGRHFTAAQTLDPTDPLGFRRTYDTERRRGAETQVFHNLGPALELEVVLRERGWVVLSAFAQFRYLWAVGDRELTFRDDLDQTVQFTYRRPANSFRGGAGVRFGWRGPLLAR